MKKRLQLPPGHAAAVCRNTSRTSLRTDIRGGVTDQFVAMDHWQHVRGKYLTADEIDALCIKLGRESKEAS